MKHSFRITEAAVGRMRRQLWIVPLLMLAIGLYTFRQAEDDLPSKLAIVFLLVAVGFGVALSGYKRYAKWAANHTLDVLDDALLFRDGDTELRVPFGAVTCLAVKRRNSKVLSVVLKYGGRSDFLSGYEELPILLQLLVDRIPQDRIKEFAWFHV